MATDAGWWAAIIAERLSQGDLILDQTFLIPVAPTVFLKSRSFKGGEPGWGQSAVPTNGKGGERFLAAGAVKPALVISHDCDLDKALEDPDGPAGYRVLAAPVAPINTVDPAMQTLILSQQVKAMLPLQGCPGLGDCYADLRLVMAVPRVAVDAGKRVASMADVARARLRAQLVEFFVRLEQP